ncbi:endospore germination permease [Aneurinibacillus terranovensis]|uniref:endospore germination permease n=1 Tax=Aneurinibacillus terranovensis TaxID=278991 RepID=UPI003CCBB6C4
MFSILIILSIIFEMFMMSSMTLRDVSYWAKVSYMPKTPLLIIGLLFCLVSFYAVRSGIQTIAITNGILLPFVILFGFFVMTANFPNKDYHLLTPILENGFDPVIKGMLYVSSGVVGIFVLTIMQQHITGNIRIFPILITGFILIILTFSPLTGAIAEFGPFEAARLRFTAYEEWRLVTFGHYLEHVDFLSIYQWLVGAFTRISLAIFLIIDLLPIQNKTKRLWLPLGLYVLCISVTLIPISDMEFMKVLKIFYLPFTFTLMVGLSLLLGFLVFISSHKVVAK